MSAPLSYDLSGMAPSTPGTPEDLTLPAPSASPGTPGAVTLPAPSSSPGTPASMSLPGEPVIPGVMVSGVIAPNTDANGFYAKLPDGSEMQYQKADLQYAFYHTGTIWAWINVVEEQIGVGDQPASQAPDNSVGEWIIDLDGTIVITPVSDDPPTPVSVIL